MKGRSTLKVAILGSGKIGTDLLVKTQRSPYLECVLCVGRRPTSLGLIKAQEMGVETSIDSIDAIEAYAENIDVVFDATSAQDHFIHAPILESLGIKVIDLTPAELGPFAVPCMPGPGLDSANNLNMVTCGGQSSIPVVNVLSKVFPELRSLHVCSTLAEDSVGPATLANIDHYYQTTADALAHFSKFEDIRVDLNLETSAWKPDMLTRISAYTENIDLSLLYVPLQRALNQVRSYVPGYNIVGTPKCVGNSIEILVSVRGQGDWVPRHAGNLDIINCAAIDVVESYARHSSGTYMDSGESDFEGSKLIA